MAKKGIQPKTHRESLISSVKNRLMDITLWDYENELLQADRNGTTYPTKFIEYTTLYKVISENLLEVDLNFLTEKMLEDLLSITKATTESLNQFSKNLLPVDSTITEEGKVDSFLRHFEAFQNIALTIFSFTSSLGYRKQDTESNEILKKLRSQSEEADEKIKNLDLLTQKAGIAGYSQLYKDISIRESLNASFWLKWTAVSVTITFIGGITLLFFQKEGLTDDINIIQFTFTKIVIISCLFLAIGVCLKNYRAHKHNEIINLHKSSALATFDALVKTQADESTKNSMLLTVTNTIFGIPTTGFNTQDNSSLEMSGKILEMLSRKN